MSRLLRPSILAKLIPAFGMVLRNRIARTGWRSGNGMTAAARVAHVTEAHNEPRSVTREVRYRLRRLLGSGRSIVMLSTVVTATIGATAGFTIWHNRQSALEEHQRNMNSTGIVLAEQTSRYVQVIDLIVQEVQSRIATLKLATPADFEHQLGTQEIHSYLAERLKNVPQVDHIALIDANGMVLNGSQAWPIVRMVSSGRDFHQYFKDHDDSDLFVGSSSKSRGTGNLSLYFARRINGPDRRFLGLVLGVVEIKYLIDFYQAAGEQAGEAVTLLRRDGTMLIRYPDPEMAIGVKLSQKSPWYARVAEGGGSYVTPGTLDGVLPSLVSVHPLRDYPLVVDVLMEEAEIFAEWKRETAFIVSFALAAALTLLGLFWMLARQFRRQTEQNTALELGHQQFGLVLEEKDKTAELLRRTNLRFDTALNNMSHGILMCDADGQVLVINRRCYDLYGIDPANIPVDATYRSIVALSVAAGNHPGRTVDDIIAYLARTLQSKQRETIIRTTAGGRVIAIVHEPMLDGGWVATHEDITERQQAEASIVFMARHDALTKLPNRVLFRERMEQAIALVGREAEFSVMCLDLDNFKLVNDTMGHPVGDGLLVAVADRLSACVREVDTVARLGGDEFAIIQLGVRQPDDAEVLAARIVAAFLHPFEVGGHQVMTGVSIGVAVAPGDGASYETLMRDADIALYLAKAEGGGATRFFEPEMDTRIHIRRLLELDLQGAIIRNEFELYYQPLVSLTTNKISGFEALLRWHHPVRGLVSPMDFIPVAEETGMIVAIGEWVLHAACFEAENWSDDITIAVNLSPVQFKKGDLVGTVQAALAASGLRPNRLELEITESVFLRDTVDTLAVLQQLRTMGIGVALDDFGTGYSSLSYLRSFPFSKIKIDQSYVRDLMTNKESVSIIRAVIGLGQSLGIKTIAEGVETREQLDRLRDKGCTEVQGYLFSRPRPASEVPALIERLQQVGQGAFSAKD
jgi:diguanylate cyclase (GGDEF)-like protein